jgi:adenylate cyclase
VLIGELFYAALGHLIEHETGIAGLTISPTHTRYALHEGRSVGKASMDTVTILFSDIEHSTLLNERLGDARWMALLREHNAIVRREEAFHKTVA